MFTTCHLWNGRSSISPSRTFRQNHRSVIHVDIRLLHLTFREYINDLNCSNVLGQVCWKYRSRWSLTSVAIESEEMRQTFRNWKCFRNQWKTITQTLIVPVDKENAGLVITLAQYLFSNLWICFETNTTQSIYVNLPINQRYTNKIKIQNQKQGKNVIKHFHVLIMLMSLFIY
jgi:hypothetical protein